MMLINEGKLRKQAVTSKQHGIFLRRTTDWFAKTVVIPEMERRNS